MVVAFPTEQTLSCSRGRDRRESIRGGVHVPKGGLGIRTNRCVIDDERSREQTSNEGDHNERCEDAHDCDQQCQCALEGSDCTEDKCQIFLVHSHYAFDVA